MDKIKPWVNKQASLESGCEDWEEFWKLIKSFGYADSAEQNSSPAGYAGVGKS